MAERVREQRAQGRERRRSLAAKPFEELDETAGDDRQPTPLDAAKGVAATAAAAAIAGALAGAAKALIDRGSPSSDDEAQDDEPREPEAEHTPPQQDEPSDEEQEAQPEDDEPQAGPPTAEAEDEPGEEEAEPEQPRAAEQDADEPTAEHDENSDGARSVPPSDAIRIVEQAREHLKNLLGEDAESVSGIERENGNWSVTLEVVEMHRIPESTDILSSYSAVLDDDGDIVSLTRGRRYRRSQVEEG